MENIFKVIKISIFIGVIIYLILFTLSVNLTTSKFIDIPSLVLIFTSAVISLIVLKISHLNNIAESKISLALKIVLSHLSIILFTGIPVIWNDLNSSAWFSGVGSIIFGFISGACLVIFTIISYFIVYKFPNSKFSAVPVVVLSIIMLTLLTLATYEDFNLVYLINSHNSTPEVINQIKY